MLDSHLEPGASSGEEYLDDSSEQGCFVLEGELTVWLDGGEPVTLRASDSFQLQPHASFRYANSPTSPPACSGCSADKRSQAMLALASPGNRCAVHAQNVPLWSGPCRLTSARMHVAANAGENSFPGGTLP